jgi:hypothetical protein
LSVNRILPRLSFLPYHDLFSLIQVSVNKCAHLPLNLSPMEDTRIRLLR